MWVLIWTRTSEQLDLDRELNFDLGWDFGHLDLGFGIRFDWELHLGFALDWDRGFDW